MESGRFDNIYEDTRRIENILRQMAQTMNQCTTNLNNELERKQVLVAGRDMSRSGRINNPSGETKTSSKPIDSNGEGEMKRMMGDDDVRFDTIAGVLKTSFVAKFRRQLFRATRGNCYMQTRSIPKEVGLRDPETQAEVEMSVFMIFFRAQAIRERITRVIDAFGAHKYTDIPDFSATDELEEAIANVNVNVNEYRTIMETTENKQIGILRTEVAPSLQYWLAVAHRRKAIFHTVTKFR